MGRKRYAKAKAGAAKALDSLDRAYMGLVKDLKERHEVLGEPSPETGDTSAEELKARYPGLDNVPKHAGAMSPSGRQEDFKSSPPEEPASAEFKEGKGPS